MLTLKVISLLFISVMDPTPSTSKAPGKKDVSSDEEQIEKQHNFRPRKTQKKSAETSGK